MKMSDVFCSHFHSFSTDKVFLLRLPAVEYTSILSLPAFNNEKMLKLQTSFVQLMLIFLLVASVSSENYNGIRARNRYSYNIEEKFIEARTPMNDLVDEDTVEASKDDNFDRDLVRGNTMLSYLVDHTQLSTYDKREWQFLFILILAISALVGIVRAVSCDIAFASSEES